MSDATPLSTLRGHQWLPFTANRQFRSLPRVIVAAEGLVFTTQDGRQVLDGVSSLWCTALGHKHARVNAAIKQQVDRLDYATAFGFSNDQSEAAAAAIAGLCPGDLKRVFFCNSGSEAMDTALKMALAYHRARGQGQRTVFIGRERGYHGVNFGGMSVGGIAANRKVFGAQFLPRVDHMRFIHDPKTTAFYCNEVPQTEEDFAEELESRIIPLHDASNIAAVIVEPVAGSAGWYVPPQGYLQRLRAICDKHGILLIFDEVITGFGRMGTPMAADFFGVVPDMLNFAKIVTNGVVPMGGVVCREGLFQQVVDIEAPAHAVEFLHGYTYSGNPLAAAAACATVAALQEEDLFARSAAMGPYLGTCMQQALRDLPGVISLRCLGLAGAVELQSRTNLPGQRAFDVFLECFAQGLVVRAAADNLVLAPAFTVSKAQIDTMVGILAAAIRKVAV